jgi:mono/diheme cytochrome c family protein
MTVHLEARYPHAGMRLLRRFSVCLIVSSVASAQGTSPAGQPQSISQFRAAKAVRLMRERLPCAGCHVFGGAGGRIGPDLSRVAERRPASYVRRMIMDPQAAMPGTPMPKVPMPPATRELIVAYLTGRSEQKTVESRGPEPAPRVSSAPAARTATSAAALYGRFCASCHGARGRGDGRNARFLPVRPAVHADSAYMSSRSDDRLFDAIYAGGYPLGRSVTMPPFGETLTGSEVWSLVRHLRELCRCAGPAWSPKGAPAP